MDKLGLCLLGAVQSIALLLIASIDHWHQSLDILAYLAVLQISCYAIAVYKWRNSDDATLLRLIVVWAVVFRLISGIGGIAQDQLLSTDLYRYLWEGIVVAEGFNPYRFAPNAQELATLSTAHSPLWQQVDHKSLAALYPPLSHYFFSICRGNEVFFRLMLFVAECLLLLLLLKYLRMRNLASGRLLWYAWCPIPLLESGFNAHLDSLFLVFLLAGTFCFASATKDKSQDEHPHRKNKQLADRKPFPNSFFDMQLAFVFLVAAALIKQTALLAVAVALLRLFYVSRWYPTRVATVLAPALVFAAVCMTPFTVEGLYFGSLAEFSTNWRFNGHAFYLLEQFSALLLPNALLSSEIVSATLLTKALLLVTVVTVAIFIRGKTLEAQCFVLYFIICMLSPVRYPWYQLSFLVWLPLLPNAKLATIAASSAFLTLLSYEVWNHPDDWQLPLIIGLLQYTPLIFLPLLWWRCRTPQCNCASSTQLNFH